MQLNMKVSGVADRRRAVVRRMGLLFTLNNVLQRRQMRRADSARSHRGDWRPRAAPGCERSPGTLPRARAGDVAPRLGVNVTSCNSGESLQHLSDAGAAHGEHLRQRLFRQFAARRQLMFDDSRHQRLVNCFRPCPAALARPGDDVHYSINPLRFHLSIADRIHKNLIFVYKIHHSGLDPCNSLSNPYQRFSFRGAGFMPHSSHTQQRRRLTRRPPAGLQSAAM